jgi:hypothetical protein
MKLKLYRVLGYQNGTEPVLGSVVMSFTGNQKRCTNAAKKWLKEHPQGTQPVFKWEK